MLSLNLSKFDVKGWRKGRGSAVNVISINPVKGGAYRKLPEQGCPHKGYSIFSAGVLGLAGAFMYCMAVLRAGTYQGY
jgi:hypothetical protein